MPRPSFEISIIVPVYNTEQYLPECIDSIIQQTYRNMEVILIDDGSTDSSGSICDAYQKKDNRIKVIHQTNSGALVAREEGIRQAGGRYIAFVDSDDWLEPCTIENFIEVMSIHDNADIYVGSYIVNGRTYERHFKKLSSIVLMQRDDAILEMMKGDLFNWSLCGKLYRKYLFDSLDSLCTFQVDYGEDTDANWNLFRQAKHIVYAPLAGYHYRVHDASMTHQDFSARNLAYLDRLDYIIQNSENESIVLQKVLAELFLRYGTEFVVEARQLLSENNISVMKYQNRITWCTKRIGRPLRKAETSLIEVALKDNVDFMRWLNDRAQCIWDECEDFFQRYERIYIYGTGNIARKILTFIQGKYKISGFVTTLGEKYTFKEYKVSSFDEIQKNTDSSFGLLLAMNRNNTNDVIHILKKKGIDDYLNLGKYHLLYEI